DRIQPEAEVGDGDDRDRAGEDPDRKQVAEFESLRHEVAGRGAEGEGEEDRQPVEGLASGGDDGVDREGPLAPVPGPEDAGEDEAEGDRLRLQWGAAGVGQVVCGGDAAD